MIYCPQACSGPRVIHEVLWEGKNPRPFFFSAWLAQIAVECGTPIVWCDPRPGNFLVALGKVAK